MFTRGISHFIKGLCTVGNYKTALGNDITYCRFFTTKQKLRENVDDNSLLENVQPPKNKNEVIHLPFNDSKLSTMMLKLKSKKMRSKSNLVFFEGRRLLCDAIQAGIIPLEVYFTKTQDIAHINFPPETKLFKIPYKDLKIWSDLTTCPGILTICNRPKVLEDYEGQIPVTVICDNVREPGNLGALIRTSTGAGVQEVILTDGCVDLWDPKVIRGGMGSHFRIPIYEECRWEKIERLLRKDTLFVIATNSKSTNEADIVPYHKIEYKNFDSVALVIGGETEGISMDALSMSKNYNSKLIHIPLLNHVESLNCVSALSVILFEMKRQIIESDDTETS